MRTSRAFFSFVKTAVIILAMFFSTAKANTVSYQGILTTADGDSLLSGNYNFMFGIFPSQTGGTALWTETLNNVAVSNGIYQVILGGTTALPDSIGNNRWFQITVNGTPLAPRLPITADFRAIEARRAENADSVNHIAASTTPQAGKLFPLGPDGKFSLQVMPFTLDSVLAGPGLTGLVQQQRRGGNGSLDQRVTLGVGAGDGITVNPDNVQAVLGTSVSNAELENNAVNSAKVQDNTLTAADIQPNIVSSINNVSNDGGNIDLIAGTNISIAPNDTTNTITISAGVANYLAGRCININNGTIHNTMDIFGSECIDVDYNPATCIYTVYLNQDCLDSLIISHADTLVLVFPPDSIFHSEAYARSFVVTPDGSMDSARGHWRSDGGIEIGNIAEDAIFINSNGTMVLIQDGEVVGGFDQNGEFIGKSFMVVDPETGDTLTHLTNTGGIEMIGEDGAFFINPNGTMIMVQDGQVVGGFDQNGEYIGKSFMVVDPATGDTLTHLTSDGEIVVGTGAQIRISPDEISIFNPGVDSYTTIDRGGVAVTDSIGFKGAYVEKDELFVGDINTGSSVRIKTDGTWNARHDGITVAGLDSSGEIFAKSFYTRNPETGDTIVHITSNGQILINGEPIGGGAIGDTIRLQNGSNTATITGDRVFMTSGHRNSRSYYTATGFTHTSDSAIVDVSDVGVYMLTPNQTGFFIGTDGTWEATQGDRAVAGLDSEGEIFAHSFQVKDSSGTIITHLNQGGGVLIGTGEGAQTQIDSTGLSTWDNTNEHGVSINNSGTFEITRDNRVIAGSDTAGEIFAHSFQVKDSAGNIITHLANNGSISLLDESSVVSISTGAGFIHTAGLEGVSVGKDGIIMGDLGTGNTMDIYPNGTWSALRNNVPIAGVDLTGEIIAKSFEVRDSLTGAIKAHLMNNGNLALPTGAQITIGGVPLGGGEGEIIRRTSEGDTTEMDASGLSSTNGVTASDVTVDRVVTGTIDQQNKVGIYADGTIQIKQDGQIVAGVDDVGEMFAHSFQVKDSAGTIITHLNQGGGVLIGTGVGAQTQIDSTGVSTWDYANQHGVSINNSGTFEVYRGNQIVAGSDTAGEVYAHSFQVKDSAGNIVAHLTNSGNLALPTGAQITIGGVPVGGEGEVITRTQNNYTSSFGSGGLITANTSTGANVIPEEISIGANDGSDGVSLFPDGTWQSHQNNQLVSGLSNTGELFAKSFEVRDSTGAITAHLTNSGNLVLPTGAQVTVGGVPIGGGTNPDSLRFTSGSNSTLVNATGMTVSAGTAGHTLTSGTGFNATNGTGTAGVAISNNGTWVAEQNNQLVAGLSNTGELFARSFEVRDSTGALKAHLTSAGGLTATGTVQGNNVSGTNSVFVNNVAGNISNFSEMTNTYMRSQVYDGASPQTGWIFNNNGTMQHRIDPTGGQPPMLMHEVNAAGQCVNYGEVYFGPVANNNHILGGTIQQGTMFSNNVTVWGKLNAMGVIDPIIAEVFTPHPSHKYEPGMVIVMDEYSDAVVPCNAEAQTSVMGVVAPDTAYDYHGNVSTVILGAAAPPRDNGSRLEVRVKVDAKYGKIKRGDLLTTSPTTGHAMLAKDPKIGTILGKALEPLADGTGLIKVLVTLH